MKTPTIKSLKAELAKRNQELRDECARRESERDLRYQAESKQREIEAHAREDRKTLNGAIEELREQIRQSDIAGNAYQNKVLIYFMALANPEVSKDTEHMKRLMADLVQPYSTVDWRKKLSDDPCFFK